MNVTRLKWIRDINVQCPGGYLMSVDKVVKGVNEKGNGTLLDFIKKSERLGNNIN